MQQLQQPAVDTARTSQQLFHDLPAALLTGERRGQQAKRGTRRSA